MNAFININSSLKSLDYEEWMILLTRGTKFCSFGEPMPFLGDMASCLMVYEQNLLKSQILEKKL